MNLNFSRSYLNKIFRKLGYTRITKTTTTPEQPIHTRDMLADPAFSQIYEQILPYTMTSIERVYGLYQAVKYIVDRKIEGDFVECGVWRGGSAMTMALTLQLMGDTTRKIYLYDTFKGMSEPNARDVSITNKVASAAWKIHQKEDHNDWCYSSLEDTKANVSLTAYPQENLIFIEGQVEDTIPAQVPSSIALLRLDTDWYESTFHELVHLYPLLTKNGILILDDYGHWQGARAAVDEYLKQEQINIYLSRIDYTGRIGIKLDEA